MVMSMIALSAGIISGLIGILMIWISIRLLIQYFRKRNIAGLYLTLSVIAYTMTIWSAFITYMFGEMNRNTVFLFQEFIYAFAFLGTIFSFLFASKIFFEAKNVYKIIYLLIGIAAVLLFLLTPGSIINDVSVFPDSLSYPEFTIKTVYSIVLVVFIFPTSIGIFWVAWKVSNKLESAKDKKRFRLIAIGQLMILFAFIIDTLSSVFYTNLFLYALFLNLTWVPPAIAAICYDLGWIIRKDK